VLHLWTTSLCFSLRGRSFSAVRDRKLTTMQRTQSEASLTPHIGLPIPTSHPAVSASLALHSIAHFFLVMLCHCDVMGLCGSIQSCPSTINLPPISPLLHAVPDRPSNVSVCLPRATSLPQATPTPTETLRGHGLYAFYTTLPLPTVLLSLVSLRCPPTRRR